MSKTTVYIKKLRKNAILPTKGSDAAAGYDAYACLDEDVIIMPGENIKIGTGIAVEFPDDCWMGIYARSGLAAKRGLRPANCVGVIDPDYRGEIIVALYNDSNETQTISHGDRIAQLIITKKEDWNIVETNILKETYRDAGGFGSTGR